LLWPRSDAATNALALRWPGPWQLQNALTTQPAFDVLRKLPHPQLVNIQSAPTLVGNTAPLERNMEFSFIGFA
jgi:hypothetical protein